MDAMIESLLHELKSDAHPNKVFGLADGCRRQPGSGESEEPRDLPIRALWLTRAEAMQLLSLCVASPFAAEHDEEAALFAKLGDYARRF